MPSSELARVDPDVPGAPVWKTERTARLLLATCRRQDCLRHVHVGKRTQLELFSVGFGLCLGDVGIGAGATDVDSAHPIVIERVR